jgi:hypothetical protein
MDRRILTGAVLTVMFVFVLSELVLPYIIGKKIETGLAKAYATNDIHVTVKARPALMMLGGNFSTITINGHNIRTDKDKLTISVLSTVFKDTSIDLHRLISDRIVVFRQVGSFDGTIILQEQEITQFVAQAIKGFKNVQVTLLPEKMKVSGEWTLGPASVALVMDGKLRGDKTQLKFVADQVFLNSSVVAGNFGGSTMTEFKLFDTKKLPVEATIRDVIMEEGRVVIRIAK